MDTWWIDTPCLLGSANPTFADLEKLQRDGFGVLVSLLEEQKQPPEYDVAHVTALGWLRYNIPVEDFCRPTFEQLDQFVRAGYCHIDLIHNSAALDFTFVPPHQRPEAFGPFIRVTNSYNSLRALAFDIGFYRKVCKNGLIIPDTIIRFKFNNDDDQAPGLTSI